MAPRSGVKETFSQVMHEYHGLIENYETPEQFLQAVRDDISTNIDASFHP